MSIKVKNNYRSMFIINYKNIVKKILSINFYYQSPYNCCYIILLTSIFVLLPKHIYLNYRTQ